MASEHAVDVRGLSKSFGRKALALDDVTFTIPRGSTFALIGPNGAGKTTLFSIAAGFLKPSSGHVEVLGVDVIKNISALRGRFSILPQDALFQGNIPILEQMELFCRLNGRTKAEAKETAREALALVGLEDAMSKRARQLSHGMGKRLAIAQAFLGSPEVVFLDEPTSGLDPESAGNIRNLIRKMMGAQTVVISSHNLAEIQDMCDEVAILDEGRLTAACPMRELLGGGHIVRLTLNKPADEGLTAGLRALDGVVEVIVEPSGVLEVRLDVPDDASKDAAVQAILAALGAAGFVPRSIHEGQRLEARFLELTGGKSDGLGST